METKEEDGRAAAPLPLMLLLLLLLPHPTAPQARSMEAS
jgi:hypothetical protein